MPKAEFKFKQSDRIVVRNPNWVEFNGRHGYIALVDTRAGEAYYGLQLDEGPSHHVWMFENALTLEPE